MKLPNPTEYKLFCIIDPYLKVQKYPDGKLLYQKTAKEALNPDTPSNVIKAFEEWRIIAKKEAEKNAKIGIVF